jgi:hypothetical protein
MDIWYILSSFSHLGMLHRGNSVNPLPKKMNKKQTLFYVKILSFPCTKKHIKIRTYVQTTISFYMHIYCVYVAQHTYVGMYMFQLSITNYPTAEQLSVPLFRFFLQIFFANLILLIFFYSTHIYMINTPR